jgi:hypothetical protein
MSASMRLSALANWAIRVSRAVWFLAACFSGFLFAGSANAQCGGNSVQFSGIGLMPGNPFQAERVETSLVPTPPDVANHPYLYELVARDFEGRVRIERSAGNFEMHTGAQAGSTQERHRISICDPVNQTLTDLDTLNKTAQIRHSRPSAPSASTDAQKVVCSRILPRINNGSIMQVEDLGHRTIEGVDSQGVRITMKSVSATQQSEEDDAEGTQTSLPPSNPGPAPWTPSAQERWCSEELGAVMLQTTTLARIGTKSSFGLTNLQRFEPDPALFQIPAGYTVSEIVPRPLGSRER